MLRLDEKVYLSLSSSVGLQGHISRHTTYPPKAQRRAEMKRKASYQAVHTTIITTPLTIFSRENGI